ncbi:MAG: HAD family hydrolase [Brooklawnia sp.]|jgi:Cof subfamily protein (haloacid dehalogenase superfamily)
MQPLPGAGQARPIVLTDSLPLGIDSVKVAIFDVDGTLARDDSNVSAEMIAALRDLAQAGIHVVFASGRMTPSLLKLFERMGEPGYLIACNGAVSMHTVDEEVVAAAPMSAGQYATALAVGRELGLHITIFGVRDFYAEDDGEWLEGLSGPNEGRAPVLTPLDTLDPGDRLKVMYHVATERQPEVLPRLRERFPATVQTLPEFFELTAPGVNKWSGIQPILADLGADPDQVLGAGDSENDLTWLPHVGISVAMENAYPHVKSACDYEVGHSDDDALAELLQRWVSQLRAGRDRAV